MCGILRAVVFLWLVSAACVSSLDRIHVDPVTGHFMDSHGRVRLFRGINSVIKHFPWYDPRMLDDKRLDTLKEAGFNVVRLGAMWTGVQPDGPHSINHTYVNILKEIVDKLARRGIYSLLDTHQDVLWQAGPTNDMGGYWGVPPWIKSKTPPPKHAYPWPLESINAWPCGYATEEIAHGFQLIYENFNGTRDNFALFWKYMARIFRHQKGLLGYELLNEPFAGNIHEDLSVMLPGVAGRDFLAPLYEQVHKAIREEDDSTLVFWEPVTWGYLLPYNPKQQVANLLESTMKKLTAIDFKSLLQSACGNTMETDFMKQIRDIYDSALSYIPFVNKRAIRNELSEPSIFGPGFKTPPGGFEYMNRTVMSWHYYCWALHITEGTDEPYDPSLRALCHDIIGPLQFATVRQRALELGGSGTMLTEFGLCRPNITILDSQNTLECKFVIDQMESYLESWIYWDTCTGEIFWDGEGNLIKDILKMFSRPYPIATAGTPYSLHFDVYTREFFFEYFPTIQSALEGENQPTEIFVPSIHYPGLQIQVDTSHDLSWSFSSEREDVILISATSLSAPTLKSWVRISPLMDVPRQAN